MNTQLVAVNGSLPAREDVLLACPDPSASVGITLSLRGKMISPDQGTELGRLINGIPSSRKYIAHEELEGLTGAGAETIDAIESCFKEQDISVKSKNLLTNDIVLTGSIGSFEKRFHTEAGIREKIDRHSYLSNLSASYRNPCIGLISPKGNALLALFQQLEKVSS